MALDTPPLLVHFLIKTDGDRPLRVPRPSAMCLRKSSSQCCRSPGSPQAPGGVFSSWSHALLIDAGRLKKGVSIHSTYFCMKYGIKMYIRCIRSIMAPCCSGPHFLRTADSEIGRHSSCGLLLHLAQELDRHGPLSCLCHHGEGSTVNHNIDLHLVVLSKWPNESSCAKTDQVLSF